MIPAKVWAFILWVVFVVWGAAVALCCAAVLTGCGAPVNYDPTEVDGDPGPASDEPWAPCADVGPCEGWAYCDELGAREQPACNLTADLSCKRWYYSAGEACFDGALGTCDGAGICQ